MIIKSIAHHSPKLKNIRNAFNYVFAKDKVRGVLEHEKPIILKQNLRGFNIEKWCRDILVNDENRTYSYGKKRVVLRHEIISFSPESTPYLTRSVVKNLAKKYMEMRAPTSMAACAFHFDKEEGNQHCHFLFSAVDIEGKGTSISKSAFKRFKIDFQNLQIELYPELEHSVVNHTKSKKLELSKTFAEQRMNDRGVKSKKQIIAEKVLKEALQSKSLEELEKRLQVLDIETYRRNGVFKGILINGQKKRLLTLGVGKQHLMELTLEQKRLEQLRNLKSKEQNLEKEI